VKMWYFRLITMRKREFSDKMISRSLWIWKYGRSFLIVRYVTDLDNFGSVNTISYLYIKYCYTARAYSQTVRSCQHLTLSCFCWPVYYTAVPNCNYQIPLMLCLYKQSKSEIEKTKNNKKPKIWEENQEGSSDTNAVGRERIVEET